MVFFAAFSQPDRPGGGQPSGPEGWDHVYRYWLSKHIDGRPPARRDLDPLIEIPRLVANIMLIDVLPDGFRYRLVGSENVLRGDHNPTGLRVGSSPLAANVRSGWIAAYDLVSRDRKPRLVISRMAAGLAAKHALIVLPLVNPDREIDCLLAAAFYEGDFKQGTEIKGLITQEIQL
jgi:hypothetical protein